MLISGVFAANYSQSNRNNSFKGRINVDTKNLTQIKNSLDTNNVLLMDTLCAVEDSLSKKSVVSLFVDKSKLYLKSLFNDVVAYKWIQPSSDETLLEDLANDYKKNELFHEVSGFLNKYKKNDTNKGFTINSRLENFIKSKDIDNAEFVRIKSCFESFEKLFEGQSVELRLTGKNKMLSDKAGQHEYMEYGLMLVNDNGKKLAQLENNYSKKELNSNVMLLLIGKYLTDNKRA